MYSDIASHTMLLLTLLDIFSLQDGSSIVANFADVCVWFSDLADAFPRGLWVGLSFQVMHSICLLYAVINGPIYGQTQLYKVRHPIKDRWTAPLWNKSANIGLILHSF